MVAGMRRKTSLTMDGAGSQSRARGKGKPMSQWTERAILKASRNDVEILEAWERALPPEERALLAALAEADGGASLDS